MGASADAYARRWCTDGPDEGDEWVLWMAHAIRQRHEWERQRAARNEAALRMVHDDTEGDVRYV